MDQFLNLLQCIMKKYTPCICRIPSHLTTKVSNLIYNTLQAGLGYAEATEKYDIDEESFSGYAFGGGQGLAYFITGNISIDPGIQVTSTKLTYSEDAKVRVSYTATM